MTLVWGLGLLLDALLRVALSFSAPVATAAAVSPWIALVCIGGLILWNVFYARARVRAARDAGFSVP